jgi:ABC-type amino acid transport system permease subunit
MIKLNGHFKFFISVLLAVVTGCSDPDLILQTKDDLNGAHIAVLDNSVDREYFEHILPDSKEIHFKSASEFLLALAIGKCDAGILDRDVALLILEREDEYVTLDYPEFVNDSISVIAHRRVLPGRNVKSSNDDIIEESIRRIHGSIISHQYWRLILRGFGATIAMFLMGIIMAFILAVLMLGMNASRYLRLVSRPLSYFIRKIHDVPSIVLIFFFYYVVFATVHVNGIFVVSIALAVYTSGSLMNVFTVHLNQIDQNQHAAAQMLGLRGWKKYRYVILPQAVKPMLPLIGAEAKVLLRATTFAGYISTVDLVKVTEIIRNQTYDVLVPLILVSAIFLLLSHIIVESLSAIYNKIFRYD